MHDPNSQHTIIISINQPWRPWRTVVNFTYAAGMIGLGVFLESAAMEWVGFLVVILTAIGLAMRETVKNGAKTLGGLTISQARARLDEIEREGRTQ